MKFVDKMMDVLWTIAGVLVFGSLMAMFRYAWITPDPVSVAIGKSEYAALMERLREDEQNCLTDTLRAYRYGDREPTQQEYDDAVRGCDRTSAWKSAE